ncbi:MAG: metallothionein [Gluconacetobacter diazotrophicus]|nr:metallothionein [Gluconacetobacter diazotrophicus]
MSISIDQVKCACPDCVCIVDASKGVQSEGRIYCDDACAKHHADGQGCHHHGCQCHG